MARMTDDEILAAIATNLSKYRDSDVRVSAEDIARVVKDKVHAEKRVHELLGRCSELIIEARKLRADRSLVGSVAHGQAAAFLHAFDQPSRDMPGLPLLPDGSVDEKTVRLRALLVLEEAFELAEAIFESSSEQAQALRDIKGNVLSIVKASGKVSVDLAQVADAFADLTYVVEGGWITFGISPQPVIDEVHRSNMAKLGGTVDDTGKRTKPKDWKPPNVAEVLHRQGWKACDACDVNLIAGRTDLEEVHTCGRRNKRTLTKE